MSIDNITAEVTLMARVCRPGTGYNGFLDPGSIRTSHEEIYNRKMIARLSLILRKAEDGDIEIIYSFLNGVRRKMLVDFGASKSVIFNTDRPWRSRCFSIENVEDDPNILDENFKPDEEKDHSNSNNGKYIEKDERYDYYDETENEVYLLSNINNAVNRVEEADQEKIFSTDKDVRNILRTKKAAIQQAHSSNLSSPDDPKRGGKVGNEKDNDEVKEKGFCTSKISHEAMMASAPETSLFESLRKGYKAVSKSIIGMLYNKEGNLVTNRNKHGSMENRVR